MMREWIGLTKLRKVHTVGEEESPREHLLQVPITKVAHKQLSL